MPFYSANVLSTKQNGLPGRRVYKNYSQYCTARCITLFIHKLLIRNWPSLPEHLGKCKLFQNLG